MYKWLTFSTTVNWYNYYTHSDVRSSAIAELIQLEHIYVYSNVKYVQCKLFLCWQHVTGVRDVGFDPGAQQVSQVHRRPPARGPINHQLWPLLASETSVPPNARDESKIETWRSDDEQQMATLTTHTHYCMPLTSLSSYMSPSLHLALLGLLNCFSNGCIQKLSTYLACPH